MTRIVDTTATCPLPVSTYDRITLGHGSGGLLSVSASSAQGWLSFASGNIGQNLSPGAQASVTVYASPTPGTPLRLLQPGMRG